MNKFNSFQINILITAAAALAISLGLHAPLEGYESMCDRWSSFSMTLPSFMTSLGTCEESLGSVFTWKSKGAVTPFIATIGQLIGWILAIGISAAVAVFLKRSKG